MRHLMDLVILALPSSKKGYDNSDTTIHINPKFRFSGYVNINTSKHAWVNLGKYVQVNSGKYS